MCAWRSCVRGFSEGLRKRLLRQGAGNPCNFHFANVRARAQLRDNAAIQFAAFVVHALVGSSGVCLQNGFKRDKWLQYGGPGRVLGLLQTRQAHLQRSIAVGGVMQRAIGVGQCLLQRDQLDGCGQRPQFVQAEWSLLLKS